LARWGGGNGITWDLNRSYENKYKLDIKFTFREIVMSDARGEMVIRDNL
jgi:hypothetical protein